MEQKQYNPLESTKLSREQNANMIDSVLNNLPPELETVETDKVKEPPALARTLECEER